MIAELQQSGHDYSLAEMKHVFVHIFVSETNLLQRLFTGSLMGKGDRLLMSSLTDKLRLLETKIKLQHDPCRSRLSLSHMLYFKIIKGVHSITRVH